MELDSKSIQENMPKRSTRRNIVYGVLIFCCLLIGYIVYTGDADNTLHQSTLSWAFSLSGFVIAGYVFGQVVDNWNVIRHTKKD